MKEKDYLDIDFIDIITQPKINRRDFLKRFGGGIIVFFTIGDASTLIAQRERPGYPSDFNAYLRIGADGRVACLVGKIEMGQGVITSLAQELAEELDVSFDSVDMVMGDTDRCPWDMGTFGSLTTRSFGPYLRKAAAEARAVLMEMGAEYLKIPIEMLQVSNGVISHKKQSNKMISYAELTKGKIIERHLAREPIQKKPADFKIMGKAFFRSDSLEKVTGKAKFAGDIQLPGMLYAKILRPPAHDAQLKSINTEAAEEIEGVQVVRDGDLIAVLHPNPEVAEKALTKINAKFDIPELAVDDKSIFDHLLKVADSGEVVAEGGNLADGEKQAATMVEATYLNSYVAHSPMEPHTAVAHIDGGKITVWASTQAPFRVKSEIERELNFPSDKVRVITPFVGGGFGGKTRNQQAIEAARLAKLTGKPVQVAWTRKEEFFFDTFRPAAVVKIKSGLSDSGEIALWDYHVYFAGERGSQHFYNIAHHRTKSYGGWSGANSGAHPFRVGAWRAPANNTNTFARESHIDMLAEKSGLDPFTFRMKHLKEEKMKRVLKAAAEKFDKTFTKAPSGRGIGISCGIDADTYVSAIAEVEVDKKTGKVQVKRVVSAQDMGLVVNPQGATIQMEGCITMGLGYALSEEIHFKGGNILDTNFDTYELPRFSWLPKIETVLVDTDDEAPHGGGEPAIITMGAVIANAIYDAIGVRLFQLPMTPERIKEAMGQG